MELQELYVYWLHFRQNFVTQEYFVVEQEEMGLSGQSFLIKKVTLDEINLADNTVNFLM
jgi:hypothetical protein